MIFGEMLLNKKLVFWFTLQISSKTFLIKKEFYDILSQIYLGFHVKCPLFWSDFIETRIF